MGLLWWILIGLALGLLARWITGARVSWFWSMIAGLIGALVGGFIGRAVGWGGIVRDFSPWSLILSAALAIIAVVLLASFRRSTGTHDTTSRRQY